MVTSIYIHVPFCAGFCDYCDFYSAALEENDPRPFRYIDRALLDAEILFGKYEIERVPAVYIGGGTPSVLGARGITRLLKGIGSLLPGEPGEFTVEVNPESADEAFLAACGENGVNRISAGVQTFHERSRRAVHRRGSAALLPRRLALIARFFPGSFSADLLSGLPFQDEAALLRDIETTLSFGPAHVSLYSLTIEDGTPLAERTRGAIRREETGLLSEEDADGLWLSGRDALERAGYAQYEVSNFSLPGKESHHNIRYWRMENWLALGPGASGTLIDDKAGTGRRYTVKADVDAWLDRRAQNGGAENAAAKTCAAGPPVTEEMLDRLTLMKETLLMGFRFTGGPDGALFRKRFGREIGQVIPRTVAAWRTRGLFREDRAALTREGLLFLNSFLTDAFLEMETCE
ncbi:MAG: coproporphyrinogen III oxidase family protein [Treponema sp.]|jgi:oxygen-independent coproporphyrinogen-3 oxidase|nr:coproporphyrinogen III oxidase family protein [Treponema sp.]